MLTYLYWSLLLIAQNASFTWVSRARNSSSLGYHAVAAVFSNGVWFASQFVLIGIVAHDIKSIADGVMVGSLYIASTVFGSVGMHWFVMGYLEGGKRACQQPERSPEDVSQPI